MKVLEKGTGQKGWAKEYKCAGYPKTGGGCGALLLVEHGDLFQRSFGGNYAESGKPEACFKCCECGVETMIPNADYPFYANTLPKG